VKRNRTKSPSLNWTHTQAVNGCMVGQTLYMIGQTLKLHLKDYH